MNLYEYSLLLAHVGATPEQINIALRIAGRGLDEEAITHQGLACDWFDYVDFDNAVELPISWVVIGFKLRQLPHSYNEKGLPNGLDREKAKTFILTEIKTNHNEIQRS